MFCEELIRVREKRERERERDEMMLEPSLSSPTPTPSSRVSCDVEVELMDRRSLKQGRSRNSPLAEKISRLEEEVSSLRQKLSISEEARRDLEARIVMRETSAKEKLTLNNTPLAKENLEKTKGLIGGAGGESTASIVEEGSYKWWQKSKELSAIKTMSVQRRIEIATMWIYDAVAGRQPKLRRLRGLPFKVYKFVHPAANKYWKYFMYLVIVIQTFVLPAFEPASTWDLTDSIDNDDDYKYAVYADVALQFILLLDFLFNMYATGIKYIRRASLNVRASGVIRIGAMINIIVVVFHRKAFRLDRLVRPTEILFNNADVRNLAADLVRTLRSFGGVMALYMFIVCIWSMFGVLIFGNPEDNYKGLNYDLFANCTGLSGNTTTSVTLTYFPEELFTMDHLLRLAVNLFILTSLEGWPDISAATYEMDTLHRSAAIVYWVTFVMISIMFLANIAVPLVYGPFRQRQRDRYVKEKFTERKAIVAAFQLLDTDESKKLNINEVKDMFEHLGYFGHQIRIMLQILDSDGDGSIDLVEFFDVISAMKTSVSVTEDTVTSPYVGILGRDFRRKDLEALITVDVLSNFSGEDDRLAVDSPRGNRKSKQGKYGIFQSARLDGDGSKLFLERMCGLRVGVLSAAVFLSLAVFVCTCFFYKYDPTSKLVRSTLGTYTSLFILEYIVLALSRTMRAYWKSGRTAKVHTLFVFAVTVLLLGAVITLPFDTRLEGMFWKMLQAAMILTLFRFISFSRMASRMVFVTAKMSEILITLLIIILMSCQFYVYFGMEAFSNYKISGRPDGESEFGKYASAEATVFQLFTGEGWNNVFASKYLEPNTSDMVDFFTVLYFFTFHALVNIYLESIVLAIFLDSFSVMKDTTATTTVREVTDNAKAARRLGIKSKRFKVHRKLRLEEILHKDYMHEQRVAHIKELSRLGVLDDATVSEAASVLENQKLSRNAVSRRDIKLRLSQEDLAAKYRPDSPGLRKWRNATNAISAVKTIASKGKRRQSSSLSLATGEGSFSNPMNDRQIGK